MTTKPTSPPEFNFNVLIGLIYIFTFFIITLAMVKTFQWDGSQAFYVTPGFALALIFERFVMHLMLALDGKSTSVLTKILTAISVVLFTIIVVTNIAFPVNHVFMMVVIIVRVLQILGLFSLIANGSRQA